ncbi:MAG: hypothetical protein ACE5H2_04420 [Terriglobia bacterium]
MGWLTRYLEQVVQLGAQYNVNPFTFAAIYLAATPLFIAGLYWLLRSYRRKEPLFLPALLTGFSFCCPYLYLILFGRGLPWYIYAAVIAVVGLGGGRAYLQIRAKLSTGASPPEP